MRLPRFSDLARFRVHDILLVSSLYDSFILAEDGELNEVILKEFLDLNVRHTPGMTHVSSAEDAVRLAGANESLRQRVGGPPGAIGGLMEGDPVAEAGQHLPEDVARAAWEQGLAMSVDDAVAQARAVGS